MGDVDCLRKMTTEKLQATAERGGTGEKVQLRLRHVEDSVLPKARGKNAPEFAWVRDSTDGNSLRKDRCIPALL